MTLAERLKVYPCVLWNPFYLPKVNHRFAFFVANGMKAMWSVIWFQMPEDYLLSDCAFLNKEYFALCWILSKTGSLINHIGISFKEIEYLILYILK